MERHEKFCGSNPENWNACSDCEYIERETIEIHDGEQRGRSQSSGFRCTKLDKLLYPLKAVKLGLLERFPHTFEDQELMPKQCDSFKSKYTEFFNF